MKTQTFLQLHNALKEIKNYPISDFIEPIKSINPANPISKAVGFFSESDIYEIFFISSDKIYYLSLRDIMGVRNFNSKISTYSKIISPLNENDSISKAVQLITVYRLRSYPILQNNTIIGKISSRLIINKMKEKIKISRILASDIMTPKPVVINSDEKLLTASKIMGKKGYDQLPVMENNRLSGIITTKEILKTLVPQEGIGRKTIGTDSEKFNPQLKEIFNSNVETSDINDDLSKISSSILNSNYSIVTFGDEIHGIVTQRDIISLLGEKIDHEIPIFIVGLPDNFVDSELAKSKFKTSIKLLSHILPEIVEARSRIKMSQKGVKTKYEIDVTIISSSGSFYYSNSGWDMASLFDGMSNSIKSRINRRKNRRNRVSARYA